MLEVSSYQRITLLNLDTKIFSKVLENWLSRIIVEYISTDQTGFIPGGNISDNICRTLNIILYGKNKNLESVIFSVDFEKVFDSVQISYIMQLLDVLGFSENFILALKLYIIGQWLK